MPTDVYRRLAADLRTAGVRVIVDLAGDRLEAALSGGVWMLKVSDEELLADARITERVRTDIVRAMRQLQREGAERVVVTRGGEPALLLDDGGEFIEIVLPALDAVDASGAGDSFFGAFAAVVADGGSARRSHYGAAAGAQNVTRHGLGAGDAQTILRLRELVTTRSLEEQGDESDAVTSREVTLEELAASIEDVIE